MIHLNLTIVIVALSLNGLGTSLVVQWLGLCASTAGGEGSILGQGTKIPHAMCCGQKKKSKWSVRVHSVSEHWRCFP